MRARVDAAGADQKVLHLGLVGAGSPDTAPEGLRAFSARIPALGYVEGEELDAERRWANGQLKRRPALMEDLVARKVDVIVTSGTPAAMAAKNSTTTIPIVVSAMGDPLGTGLVASFARLGGNLTGLSLEMTEQ